MTMNELRRALEARYNARFHEDIYYGLMATYGKGKATETIAVLSPWYQMKLASGKFNAEVFEDLCGELDRVLPMKEVSE